MHKRRFLILKMLRNSFNTSVTFRSELSSGRRLCSPEKTPAAILKWTQKAGAWDLLRRGKQLWIPYFRFLLAVFSEAINNFFNSIRIIWI